MATYNIALTTNANQEKGLDLILARMNADRARETPPKAPFADKTEMLTKIFDGVITDYARQYKSDLRERVGNALDAATNAKVLEVATALGVAV